MCCGPHRCDNLHYDYGTCVTYNRKKKKLMYVYLLVFIAWYYQLVYY